MSKDDISKLVDSIRESGVLGRSSIYPRLLDYLVENTSQGQSCSEVDLAEHVFFKRDTFDQTTDSSVRVYVHNLRKKLQRYYENAGQKENLRILIPRGEYRVEVLEAANYQEVLEAAASRVTPRLIVGARNLSGKKYGISVALAVLFGLILAVGGYFQFSKRADQVEYSAEQLAFWGGVLSDNKPVRILLDNATGRFGIQSQTFSSVLSEQGNGGSQADTQTEVPDLLIRLVNMLEGVDRPIEIGYLSELSAQDFNGDSHILYTDHVEGITKLANVIDGLEQLEPTDLTELLLHQQQQVFYSNAISADNPRANDYGLVFSETLKLSGAEPFELVLLAGYGFAGQSAVVQIAQSSEVLTEMQLTEIEASSRGFSALFQVTVSDGFLPERILISSKMH